MNCNIKREFYRFNLKLPIEYKDYLREAAFMKSTARNRVSITQYICSLIKSDMERNKVK